MPRFYSPTQRFNNSTIQLFDQYSCTLSCFLIPNYYFLFSNSLIPFPSICVNLRPPRLPCSSGRWYWGSSGRWYWGNQRSGVIWLPCGIRSLFLWGGPISSFLFPNSTFPLLKKTAQQITKNNIPNPFAAISTGLKDL